MGRRLVRSGADRNVARPDLRSRHRVGRGLRHRDDPLWKTGLGRSPAEAPAVFLTPKGLEHVGPRAFGYDLDFRSVF